MYAAELSQHARLGEAVKDVLGLMLVSGSGAVSHKAGWLLCRATGAQCHVIV